MRLRDQMTCPDRIQSGFKPFCPPLHLSWVPEIGVVVGEPHQCSRIWVLLSIPWPWPWHWSSHQGFGSCHVACGMCSGMSDSLLHDPMDCSLPASSINVIFPGKNTGVDCHFVLQEIFLTQGLNPGLPHCRQTLYCLSHQGCSNYCTIALISHTSKVMLKILQARLQ